jgi:hypothetical protein
MANDHSTEPHIQTIKERVRQLTNHLQVIIGYLEMNDCEKALHVTLQAAAEMVSLGKMLAEQSRQRERT